MILLSVSAVGCSDAGNSDTESYVIYAGNEKAIFLTESLNLKNSWAIRLAMILVKIPRLPLLWLRFMAKMLTDSIIRIFTPYMTRKTITEKHINLPDLQKTFPAEVRQ